MKNSFFILLVILLTTSCNSGNETTHPTEKFREFLNSRENTIDFLKQMDTKIIQADSIESAISLGELRDPQKEDYLLDIENVAVDNFGRIYASNPFSNSIKIFNSEGGFQLSLGRAGRGPGEFMNLSKIAINSKKNLLAALDRNEIEIFKISPDTIEYEKTIISKIENSTDICFSKDFLFVNGFKVTEKDSIDANNLYNSLTVSKPIHKFSIDSFEFLDSFGQRYEVNTGFAIFEGRLSKTLISCNDSTVVGIFENFPLISGYDVESNELLWQSSIINMPMVEFIESYKSEPIMGTKPSFHENYFYRDIITIDENHSLLMIGNRYPSNFTSDEEFEFLKNDFYLSSILINNLDGKLELLNKTKSLTYFKNDSIYIYSKPMIELGHGQTLYIADN